MTPVNRVCLEYLVMKSVIDLKSLNDLIGDRCTPVL